MHPRKAGLQKDIGRDTSVKRSRRRRRRQSAHVNSASGRTAGARGQMAARVCNGVLPGSLRPRRTALTLHGGALRELPLGMRGSSLACPWTSTCSSSPAVSSFVVALSLSAPSPTTSPALQHAGHNADNSVQRPSSLRLAHSAVRDRPRLSHASIGTLSTRRIRITTRSAPSRNVLGTQRAQR